MPIIVTDFEQGSLEWFSACCGNVGASSISHIITSTGERSKSRTDYMLELASEKITGKRDETFYNIHMKNGNEREESARDLFSMLYDVEIQKVGIAYKDENKTFHCSPDGLIGNNQGIEIKSPMMKIQAKRLLSGQLPTEYFSQIQMSLYVTERDLWYFVSHYEGLKPLIIECRRDEAFIKKLEEELNVFNEELLQTVEKLR
jgi:putative phage-type endonuclease